MRLLVAVTLLLAVCVSLTVARRGSISNSLFEDDMNDDARIMEDDDINDAEAERRRSPCFRKKCYRGETCIVNKDQEAKCVCVSDCSYYRRKDGRLKVCSNKNVTYETECDLDRDHCLCKRNKKDCSNPGVRKIQLEYYGACQEMLTCQPDEEAQFPDRMREWLFVVMETMDQRNEMEEYHDLVEEAKQDEHHAMGAIWKFCDLDTDPQDRSVSRRELQYTVRSLRVLEHCVVPFLDTCDANDDQRITLPEWGACLGVDHDKIANKCPEQRQKQKRKRR